MIKWLRYKLAYLIAPDYFNDIEYRFSELLYYTTGGLLSKTNYSIKTMVSAVNDYQQRCCDKCEYKKGGAE